MYNKKEMLFFFIIYYYTVSLFKYLLIRLYARVNGCEEHHYNKMYELVLEKLFLFTRDMYINIYHVYRWNSSTYHLLT